MNKYINLPINKSINENQSINILLQLLNRDLWSNIGVKSIIGEHFVFWQQYRESEEAHRYMTFYKVIFYFRQSLVLSF